MAAMSRLSEVANIRSQQDGDMDLPVPPQRRAALPAFMPFTGLIMQATPATADQGGGGIGKVRPASAQ